MSAPRIHVRAPAKINLTLRITGRRADGYHLLESLFAFTAWGDDLILDPANDLSLTITGPSASSLSADADNLVLQAARLLQGASGRQVGARMALSKRIPVAAGLGGGSADAAATLRGLNALWDLHWPASRLEALAGKLGADVPACIRSQAVMAKGIGDILSEAPALPPLWIVLVNPGVETPTPAVFSAYRKLQGDKPFASAIACPHTFADMDALTRWLAMNGNDLTPAARSVTPAIGDVLKTLGEQSEVRYSALSGSGATCFGICTDDASANRAAAALKAVRPGWHVTASGLIGTRLPE